jgi:hypothetical protein
MQALAERCTEKRCPCLPHSRHRWGAHRGFIISSDGFQSGAHEAAEHSNVDLVNWSEFQRLFAERWFRTFMAPRLLKEGMVARIHGADQLANCAQNQRSTSKPAGAVWAAAGTVCCPFIRPSNALVRSIHAKAEDSAPTASLISRATSPDRCACPTSIDECC